MKFFTRILIATAILLFVYIVIPPNGIDLLSRFALGWMIMDIVNGILDRQENGMEMNEQQFQEAMQEFLNNGGQVEKLPYHGPSGSELNFNHKDVIYNPRKGEDQ